MSEINYDLLMESIGDLNSIDLNKNVIDPNEVLNNLIFLKKKVENYYNTSANYFQDLQDLSSSIVDSETQLKVIEESKVYYQKAVDLIYEKSIGELEKILNLALNYIFYDTGYTIKINMTDKRGKSLEFVLIDNQGNELDIMNGVGFGVRTVVAFIIHIYYLINKGSFPILFLDEKFTGLSTEYINNFINFINTLCKEKNLILVLISHDTRFQQYATNVFVVSRGEVNLKNISNNVI